MIVYKLKCDINHIFECWFRNSAAFEEQQRKKLLSCPFCMSTLVTKAPMSPRLSFQKETALPAPDPSDASSFEGEVPSSFMPQKMKSRMPSISRMLLKNLLF